MHRLLADARFYGLLQEIDGDLARAVRDGGCFCGGPLHAAHYPRRPRGGPAGLPEGYEKRFSFSCGRDGCRTRATPPSVRYLGRRWYLGAVVVLVSALRHGVSSRRLNELRTWLSDRGERLARQTVERWRRWWLETFPATPTWQAGRGGFSPPVNEALLPQSLLERFSSGEATERLIVALRFLSPVTSGSCASSLTGLRRR